MKRETFKILVEKYLQGTASNAEQQELFECYDALQRNQLSWDEAELGSQETAKHRLYTNILQEIAERESGSPKQSRKLWTKVAAAAAILLVLGSGIFFYNRYANTLRHLEGSTATRDLLANDIKPGGNKAYLTLANGKRLSLTDAANGALAKEAGVEITKTADGQIIYTTRPLEGGTTERPVSGRSLPGVEMTAMNTIETPKGGQYQVRLPDGTKVWLNAASKLIYPVAFNGREDRRVELSGEAYFEVAKDKQHPFKVKSNGQEVEVLGTHFNINSYADERGTKTTLLEGSVLVSSTSSFSPSSLPPSSLPPSSLRGGTTKQPHTGKEVASSLRFPRNDGGVASNDGVKKNQWVVASNDGGAGNSNGRVAGSNGVGTILKPNQQSINDGKTIKVSEADPSEAIAWKNGFFLFNGDDLPTVLRQISRWYDLEIKYEGKIPKRSFDGKIYRSLNLSKALEVLKYSNVKFKLEGRTLIINENN